MKIKPWLRQVLGQSLAAVVFVVVVVVMLVWLMGAFSSKVQPSGTGQLPIAGQSGSAAEAMTTVAVTEVALPIVESAVGSVQPVHGAQMASNILAKVVEANLRAGQQVKKDEVLIRLEEADLRARLQQAQAAFREAVSTRERTKSDFEQIRQLLDRQAATKRELDNAQSTLERAQALVERAGQAIVEAETVLAYATIRAPMDGIVIDKKVNVGDTVTPGQVLVGLYDPTKMQVVATVREALAQRLKVGQDVRVQLEAMDLMCTAQISEVVPEATGASRSFLVKVTGPCPPGVHVGMFARLLLDLGTQSTLVVPGKAVRRVGQLDLVKVVSPTGTGVQRRIVQLGRGLEDGEKVEVLSGLKAGETVVVERAGEVGHE